MTPFRPKGTRGGAGGRGAIAQLGERFNGIEEVVGSIPSGSTIRLATTREAAALRRRVIFEIRRPKSRFREDGGEPRSAGGAN